MFLDQAEMQFMSWGTAENKEAVSWQLVEQQEGVVKGRQWIQR